MNFDEILATVDGRGNGVMPEGWGQGRALFGGLVGAVLFDHLEKTVAAGRTLRSFSCRFLLPWRRARSACTARCSGKANQ